MRSMFLGVSLGVGLLIALAMVARAYIHRNYVPMKDRPLGEDEWGEWIYVPQDTEICINTTLN